MTTRASVKTGSLVPVEHYKEIIKSGKSKYKNKKITADTIWGKVTFDSTGEYKCYLSLVPGHELGEYTLERQKKYSLDVNGKHITNYIADFLITYPDGRQRVIDFKGVETPEFKLKSKLMEALLGIVIELKR
jgi:Protein of unknown function (DUF1064)